MAIHPIQNAIRQHLNADTSEGSIRLADFFTESSRRIALADRYLLQAMLTVIPTETEPERINAEFYELGRTWGQRFYDFIQERLGDYPVDSVHSPKDYLKDEFVEHLNSNFSYAGIGQFRILEGNRFYVIDLRNPWHFEDESANTPVMILYAGFFAELFSSISGKSLDAVLLATDDDRWRFALSQPAVIQEIQNLRAAGKTDREILTDFNNSHLL